MSDTSPAASGFAGCRVLVVEDDFIQAYDCMEWLESAGAEVVGPASNAQEAIRLIADERIDVALVDLNLGDDVSFTVIAALGERDIPFVIVTGYDETVIPADLLSIARLRKPVTEELVADALADVLTRP